MTRTAKATTTPQINDSIVWIKKNNRAARAARFLVQLFWRSLPNNDVKFSYLRFWRQRDTRSSKSFILCLYMKTTPAKQAKVLILYKVTNME